MGATNVLGRLKASLFHGDPAVPYFFPSLDVPCGRVLLGIPALLSMGLLTVLENEIVFRLEQEIPCQLGLFDREGYSPNFMLKM